MCEGAGLSKGSAGASHRAVPRTLSEAYGAASPTVARGSASGRFAVVGTFSTALDFGGTPLSGGTFDVFVVTFAP